MGKNGSIGSVNTLLYLSKKRNEEKKTANG